MSNTSKRGFASMDPNKQREIAVKGGKAAHVTGKAHEFTEEEARTAGRKGGNAVAVNRAHMAKIGRMGGSAPHVGRRKKQTTPVIDSTPTVVPSDSVPQLDEGQDLFL